MKLTRITKNDPIVRTSVGFHQSFNDEMRAYLDLYKETYGDELTSAQLIEEVLGKFMDSDKEFQRHLKSLKKGGATPSAPSPSTERPYS